MPRFGVGLHAYDAKELKVESTRGQDSPATEI